MYTLKRLIETTSGLSQLAQLYLNGQPLTGVEINPNTQPSGGINLTINLTAEAGSDLAQSPSIDELLSAQSLDILQAHTRNRLAELTPEERRAGMMNDFGSLTEEEKEDILSQILLDSPRKAMDPAPTTQELGLDQLARFPLQDLLSYVGTRAQELSQEEREKLLASVEDQALHRTEPGPSSAVGTETSGSEGNGLNQALAQTADVIRDSGELAKTQGGPVIEPGDGLDSAELEALDAELGLDKTQEPAKGKGKAHPKG